MCLVFDNWDKSSRQYGVLVIATVKPASYQHCSDGDKGNLGRHQTSRHIARISLLGLYWKKNNLTENNMKILSCMKSTVLLGTSGSDHHTGKEHYPGTSYETIKSTCFVIMGTWNLTRPVASFLLCSQQTQAAT